MAEKKKFYMTQDNEELMVKAILWCIILPCILYPAYHNWTISERVSCNNEFCKVETRTLIHFKETKKLPKVKAFVYKSIWRKRLQYKSYKYDVYPYFSSPYYNSSNAYRVQSVINRAVSTDNSVSIKKIDWICIGLILSGLAILWFTATTLFSFSTAYKVITIIPWLGLMLIIYAFVL